MASKTALQLEPRLAPSSAEKLAEFIREVFASERAFWRLCAVCLTGMAILKGLRFPNLWALTQAQLDYSHGFVKRGLLGAIYSALGMRHSHPLAVIFFLEFAIFLFLLAMLTYRSGLERRTGSLAIVVMFSSSYVLTFLTHLVGYTDIVSAEIAIALLLVRSTARRFWCAMVLVPLAVLIHENFLLMFLPVVLFSFVMDGASEPLSKHRRQTAVYLGVLVLFAVGMTLYAAVAGRISPLRVEQFHADVLARADFMPRDEFFTVLKASLGDNLRQGSHRLLTVRWYGVMLLAGCLLGPVLAGLVFFGRRMLVDSPPMVLSPGLRFVPWAGVVAILAPQSLHLLGIDAMRWCVTSVLVAYLCLATVSMRLPPGRVQLTQAERNFVIFVIALNLAGGFGLYDAVQITPYPFFPHLFSH